MNFDPLAPHYRWIEWVSAGNKLQRCRTEFLGRIPDAKNILIAGEGNGRFLVECRRRFPLAQITVVDASARMLALARQRLESSGFDLRGIRFIHANALDWKPEPASSDLIVTHFFLDCFPAPQLEQVVSNLSLGAAPGATWLLADFQTPPRGLAKYRALAIIASLYAFFRLATKLSANRLVEPDGFLKGENFALRERKTSDWGLLRSDWWRRVT